MRQKEIVTTLEEIALLAAQGHKWVRTTDSELKAKIDYLVDHVDSRFDTPIRDCLQAVLCNLIGQALDEQPESVMWLAPAFMQLCGDSGPSRFATIDWSLLRR